MSQDYAVRAAVDVPFALSSRNAARWPLALLGSRGFPPPPGPASLGGGWSGEGAAQFKLLFWQADRGQRVNTNRLTYMHTKEKESRLRTDGGRAARARAPGAPPTSLHAAASCRRRKEARGPKCEERCRRLPPASRSAPPRRPRRARLRAVLTGPLRRPRRRGAAAARRR